MPIEQKQLLVEWVNCRGLFKGGLGKFSIGYGAIFSSIRKNAFITHLDYVTGSCFMFRSLAIPWPIHLLTKGGGMAFYKEHSENFILGSLGFLCAERTDVKKPLP